MTDQPTNHRHWHSAQDDNGITWLTLDRGDSTVNSLSAAVLEELDQLLTKLAQRPSAAVVIRSGKADGFIAGADVRAFAGITDATEARLLSSRAQAILARLEALPVPTIALIHGFCLGGGLELALACRYRVATDHPATRLGFPEVQLGIHPGFGGTVRCIRQVGPLTGLPLMLTGKTLTATAAGSIGLVDHVVPERHLINAVRGIVAAPPPVRSKPWRERLAELPLARQPLTWLLRRKLAKKADPRHYPAPYALLDLWRGFGSDESANYAAEAASVAGLITSTTARNLVRVFLLQERLKAGGRGDVPPPQQIHVVGAGTMGGDIAIWCALQGLRVTIEDLDGERLGQVVKRGQILFARTLRERRAIEAAHDRLLPDPWGDGVARADLVIEAIFENAAAKRELYRRLEPRLRPTAILATNTSSIPLEELAGSLERPERLIGLHFFNPVAKMQLVEVVGTPQSDPEMLKGGAAFVHAIKRLPLPVKSSPGFLVNRILMPYLLEALTLVDEGISPAVIDRAALDFGMPIGPVRLADSVGLDICLAVAQILSQQDPPAVPKRLAEMVKAGHLGRKSGRGFYQDYNKRWFERRPAPAPPEPAAALGDRLVLRLLNEAVACRREGVVADADLLDAGMIFGTGFAPFRGGPMQHITAAGAAALQTRLRELAGQHGSRYRPDRGWDALVQNKDKP